jgi:hypothetical protein
MSPKTLLLIPILAGALAVPARAAAPTTVKSVLLRGTPVGGESERHREISASFFLSRAPLSRDVKVRIAGRAATTRKVGNASSRFYVARLPENVTLAWGRRYAVRICVKGSPCRTKRRVLPEQRL